MDVHTRFFHPILQCQTLSAALESTTTADMSNTIRCQTLLMQLHCMKACSQSSKLAASGFIRHSHFPNQVPIIIRRIAGRYDRPGRQRAPPDLAPASKTIALSLLHWLARGITKSLWHRQCHNERIILPRPEAPGGDAGRRPCQGRGLHP